MGCPPRTPTCSNTASASVAARRSDPLTRLAAGRSWPTTPVQDDLTDKWPLIQAELRRAVPEHAYRNYLAAVRPRELCDAVLVVGAPERTHRWIAERFARVLQTCAAAVLGPEVEVEVVGPSSGKRAVPEREAPVGRAQPLNPTYTFDEFVIGTGNRLAHAAAQDSTSNVEKCSFTLVRISSPLAMRIPPWSSERPTVVLCVYATVAGSTFK